MRPIVLGMDGWQGIIADDFIYHRTAAMDEVIDDGLRERGHDGLSVAVSHENRPTLQHFVALNAAILTRQGRRVHFSNTRASAPVLSYSIATRGLGGRVMVIARRYSAKSTEVERKPWLGGLRSPEVIHMIEQRANALLNHIKYGAKPRYRSIRGWRS